MSNPNKTTKYLFWPHVVLFESEPVIRAFMQMRIINAYVQDEAQKEPGEVLYVLVDASADTFPVNLKRVKKSSLYRNSYAVGDPEMDLMVIEYELIRKGALKPFLESQYSKMYPHTLLEHNLDDRFALLKKIKLDGVAHVLMHSDKGYENLIDRLGIDPHSDIGEHLKTMEYASLIQMDQEIMNSENIFNCCIKESV
jgi:hypothetical protein